MEENMTYKRDHRKKIRSAIRTAERYKEEGKVFSPVIRERLQEAESLAQGELDKVKALLKGEN